MSQMNIVEKHLRKNNKETGITPTKLASLTKLPVAAVYRVVYDLRNDKGLNINRGVRKVRGKNQTFYRLQD